MKEFSETENDTPDGAFFAMAEEMYGWTIEDWGWYAEVQDFDPDFSIIK